MANHETAQAAVRVSHVRGSVVNSGESRRSNKLRGPPSPIQPQRAKRTASPHAKDAPPAVPDDIHQQKSLPSPRPKCAASGCSFTSRRSSLAASTDTKGVYIDEGRQKKKSLSCPRPKSAASDASSRPTRRESPMPAVSSRAECADPTSAGAAARRRISQKAMIEVFNDDFADGIQVAEIPPAQATRSGRNHPHLPISIATSAMRSEQWQCGACTLINPPGATACEVCETPRPGSDAVLCLDVSGAARSQKLLQAGSQKALQEAVKQVWSEPSLKVLLTLVGNAADNPDMPKYRGPVPKDREKIKTLIVEQPGASEVLKLAGFEDEGASFMLHTPDVQHLCRVRNLLKEQENIVAGARLVRSTSGYRKHLNQQLAASAVNAAQASLFPPVKRKKPKFDKNLLREVQEDASHREELHGVPKKSPRAKLDAKDLECVRRAPRGKSDVRLRVRLPLSGQLDLSVPESMTVSELRRLLLERTGVPPGHQELRVGFPPKPIGHDCDGEQLFSAGVHDGDVIKLENLHELFLRKLESGSFAMAELINQMPPEDGDNSAGALFQKALMVLGIDLEEKDFWGALRGRMHVLLADKGADIVQERAEELRASLFLIRRLFHRHNPQERLGHVISCLPHGGHVHGQVKLTVDRNRFLSSVAPQILKFSQNDLLSTLRVNYKGEQGVDAGGLTRDFFNRFATHLADEEPSLWQLTGRGSLQPTAELVSSSKPHSSKIKSADLYRACGRVFGMAILHDCKLGKQLSHSFAKLLVGDPPSTLADLQAELNMEAGESEPDFRGGKAILEQPLSESGLAGMVTLSRVISGHAELGEVELVPGGLDIEVTDENKLEWLTSLLHHKLVVSLKPAAEAFVNGLTDIFGGTGDTCPLLCLFDAVDLVELWAGHGVEQKDVARWRAVAEVNPAVGRQAEWLWQVLAEEYDDELRGKVLQFATGSSRIGQAGLQNFSIEPGEGGDDYLPTAMTCGNMLQLPEYSSRFVLSEQLRKAAESCASFGMA